MTNQDDLSTRLIEAILPHIPFDGWSRAALRLACDDVGCTHAQGEALFPNASADLIAAYSRYADLKMTAQIQALADSGQLAEMKIRDRITMAVCLRLDGIDGHKDAARKAASFLTMPTNVSLGAKLLYQSVDAIWYAIGDNSTDWNFYSKRATLAGVYSSTLLIWLDDTSDDHVESWAFLDRRIENTLQIPALTNRVTTRLKQVVDFIPRRLRAFHRFTPVKRVF